jgi:hypothetical protein
MLLVDSISPNIADVDLQLSPEEMLTQAVEANVGWSGLHRILPKSALVISVPQVTALPRSKSLRQERRADRNEQEDLHADRCV